METSLTRGRARLRRIAVAAALALVAGCAAPYAGAGQGAPRQERLPHGPRLEEYLAREAGAPRWELGGSRLQGYLAATELSDVTRRDDRGSDAVTTDDDVTMPTVGGGGQWKLGGERVDLGLEGMMSLSARGNVGAFAAGGGGGSIAVNIDLLVVDFFGGPFVSLWISERWRIYGAAGPMVVFTDYSQDAEVEPFIRDGSGFGTGWYARLGTELLIHGGTSIGIGARFSDTRIDLDRGLGDLDIEGLQYMFTVTTGW